MADNTERPSGNSADDAVQETVAFRHDQIAAHQPPGNTEPVTAEWMTRNNSLEPRNAKEQRAAAVQASHGLVEPILPMPKAVELSGVDLTSPPPTLDKVPTFSILAETGRYAVNADIAPRGAPTGSTFDLKLSERPTDIRDASRILAAAVQEQIEELRRSSFGVNDREKIDDFVNFLEELADGLNKLADALDRVVDANAKLLTEPFFTEEARRMAHRLGGVVTKFAEAHPNISDFGIKIGLAIAGYNFMRVSGLESEAAIATIVAAILSQSFSKKK